MGVYKRGKSWVIDFYYQGKRYTESAGQVSKSVAKEILTIRRREAIQGTYKPKSVKVLFRDFASGYLENAMTNKKPSAARRNKFSIDRLLPFFGDKALGEINAFMAEQYKKERKNEGRAPATINREVETLRNMLNKAVEWGKLNSNPLARLRLFKETNEKVWALTPAEENLLLEECERRPQRERYLRDLVLFALHSGMRQEEIFNLKKVNVDTNARVISVVQSKTGKPRKVPINDTLAEILKRRCERKGTDYVFCNEDGKKLTVLTNAFWNSVAKANLIKYETIGGKVKATRFRFHDLRHTFGTRLGMAGYDTKTIMEIMGHATYRMAMRYQHPAADHKLEAVRFLDQFTVNLTAAKDSNVK